MLKNEVEARDNYLITLKQKLNQAEKERDDLELKFDKFQTSSQSLTGLLVSQKHDKQGLGYSSSENDSESLSPSCPSDRLQPSGGYNVVPPPITGNFMPPKPDLVFHTAPIAVETAHSAFTVKLSSFEPTQDLPHTNRPSAPIIEEWVSDSGDDSETTAPQIAYSSVQSTKQVAHPRHYVQPVKAPILTATPKPISPKSNRSGKRKNRKTCFVCRSVDHLIKDLLTQSKPIFITVVRPIYAVVPKIMVTRPRHAYSIDTKSKSAFRRHMTCGQSPKTSNSPPRVTAAQAPMVSTAKGKKGKWIPHKLKMNQSILLVVLDLNPRGLVRMSAMLSTDGTFSIEMSFLDIITKKVVTYFNVFGTTMLHRVFAKVNRAFVVAHDRNIVDSYVVVDESLFHP
nr:hypothetical protein [Tanacetum cinerariifolium]